MEADVRNISLLKPQRASQVALPETENKIVEPNRLAVPVQLSCHFQALLPWSPLPEQPEPCEAWHVQVELETRGPATQVEVNLSPGCDCRLADSCIEFRKRQAGAAKLAARSNRERSVLEIELSERRQYRAHALPARADIEIDECFGLRQPDHDVRLGIAAWP